MVDDDDVSDASLWVLLFSGGPISLAIGLFIVILLAYAACENNKECSEQVCARGEPKLMKHECICVERPVGK